MRVNSEPNVLVIGIDPRAVSHHGADPVVVDAALAHGQSLFAGMRPTPRLPSIPTRQMAWTRRAAGFHTTRTDVADASSHSHGRATNACRLRCTLLATFIAVAACTHTRRAASQPVPCGGSPPNSTLSWKKGGDEFTIHGRVMALGSDSALSRVYVRLTPGPRATQTDTSGSFTFPGLVGGRYRLEIHPFGRRPVADSVTVDRKGLEVTAVIASYVGDIECVVR